MLIFCLCFGGGSDFRNWQFHHFKPATSQVYHGEANKINFCSVLAFEGVWADQVDAHSFPWSVMTILGGSFPYLSLCLLFVWLT